MKNVEFIKLEIPGNEDQKTWHLMMVLSDAPEDILASVINSLWGVDLCHFSTTCHHVHGHCVPRLSSCQHAEMCVKAIRRKYSPEQRGTMERIGLLEHTKRSFERGAAEEFLLAYENSPEEYKDSLRR